MIMQPRLLVKLHLDSVVRYYRINKSG